MKDVYLVLDGRAGIIGLDDTPVSDDDAQIMESGTAEECCKACNTGEHGTDCVVADVAGFVQWQWFARGKWIVE